MKENWECGLDGIRWDKLHTKAIRDPIQPCSADCSIIMFGRCEDYQDRYRLSRMQIHDVGGTPLPQGKKGQVYYVGGQLVTRSFRDPIIMLVMNSALLASLPVSFIGHELKWIVFKYSSTKGKKDCFIIQDYVGGQHPH